MQKEYYLKHREEIIKKVSLNKKNKDNGMYRKYHNARARCYRKKSIDYKHYGERGIIVEWYSYNDFRKDMYDSYMEHVNLHGRNNTTLERINTNGNYSKNNCKWATWSDQAKNKRPYKLSEFVKIKMSIAKKGKKFTEEHKLKLSIARKNYFLNKKAGV